MKLTKQTKTLIGVGVLGVAAYLIWKQNQDKKNFFGDRKRMRSRSSIFTLPTEETALSTSKDSIGEPAVTKTADCSCYGNPWVGSRGKKTSTLSDGTALCENSSGFVYGCTTSGQMIDYRYL